MFSLAANTDTGGGKGVRSGARILLLLAALLATITVVAAAGCGGASDEGPYTPRASTTMRIASPPITRARFIAHMNGACRRAWKRIAENIADYGRQYPKLRGRALYARSVRKPLLFDIDFHIFDEIRIVGSPPGDAQRIERFIGPMQRAVELGQLGRWRAYTPGQVAAHFTAYNRRARRYGLTDCLVDEQHVRRVRIG